MGKSQIPVLIQTYINGPYLSVLILMLRLYYSSSSYYIVYYKTNVWELHDPLHTNVHYLLDRQRKTFVNSLCVVSLDHLREGHKN